MKVFVMLIAVLLAAQAGAASLAAQPADAELQALVKNAAAGDPQAQVDLGVLYQFGRGVEQSHEKANKWYRRAADQGFAEGQLKLGITYQYGRGLEIDYTKAVELFRLAAEQDLSMGQYKLGRMYLAGEGVEENKILAYKWIVLGKRHNGLMRNFHRTILEEIMTASEIAEGRRLAIEWMAAHQKR